MTDVVVELEDWVAADHELWQRRGQDREQLAKAQRLLAEVRLEHPDIARVTSILAGVLSDAGKPRLSTPQEIRLRHIERRKTGAAS